MYTGLVEELGSFAGRSGERYRFNAALVLSDAAIDDSISTSNIEAFIMQKTIEKPGIVIIVVSSGILVGLLFLRQAAVEDQDHSMNAGVGGTSAQIVGLLDEKTPTTVTSRVRPLSAQTEMPSATPRSGSESTSSEAPENELDKKDVSAHDQNRVYILRKVQPIYPTRALERGIEGYVLLEFTVTDAGIAIDPTVVESDPTGIFDRAALADM